GQRFDAGSIPAAAHRTITPWPTEDEAYRHIVGLFEKKGYKVIAIVADSYGYERGIRKLAGYAECVKHNGGWLVGRPDSGDPVQCVVEGLEVFGEAFGTTTTPDTGLKVIQGASIIQGDGVSDKMIFEQIYPAVLAAHFSPINVAFGMGEYNHRAVRSDTEWGYKTGMIGIDDRRYPTGYRECMKDSNNNWKRSIPGPVGVRTSPINSRVYPITLDELKRGET